MEKEFERAFYYYKFYFKPLRHLSRLQNAREWLQIKADPSVRDFLFQQTRVESLFDSEIERIHDAAHQLLTTKRAF